MKSKQLLTPPVLQLRVCSFSNSASIAVMPWLATKRGKAAYDALNSYFVSKQRVGLVEVPGYTLYVVPPNEKFLKALGLPESKTMLGIQVPAAVGDEER